MHFPQLESLFVFSTLLDVFVFLFVGPPFLFLIDYFTIAFGLLYHIIKNWLLKNGSMSFYQQHEIETISMLSG